MSVLREQFESSQVSLSGVLAGIFDSLVRRKDGTYVFMLKVDGEAVLPDGRRVRVNRHVWVPATDIIGRRPAKAGAAA